MKQNEITKEEYLKVLTQFMQLKNQAPPHVFFEGIEIELYEDNGKFFVNDFSDKNVVTSHIVSSMSFKDVVSSGNYLFAINRFHLKTNRFHRKTNSQIECRFQIFQFQTY